MVGIRTEGIPKQLGDRRGGLAFGNLVHKSTSEVDIFNWVLGLSENVKHLFREFLGDKIACPRQPC